MRTTFGTLYTEFVIDSFDKQLRLADAHGEDGWGFSMTNGELTFNNSISYKIQILGTEDHAGGTWLWGWANKASNIPNDLLVVANQLRSYGEELSIAQLTDPRSSLDDVDGHTIGLIACGFAKGKAYYRCPYENGALFVMITDAKLELLIENKIVRATRVIPECISVLEVADQRSATAAYLRLNGLDVVEDGSKLVVQVDGQAVLEARFDEMNRLRKLESRVNP